VVLPRYYLGITVPALKDATAVLPWYYPAFWFAPLPEPRTTPSSPPELPRPPRAPGAGAPRAICAPVFHPLLNMAAGAPPARVPLQTHFTPRHILCHRIYYAQHLLLCQHIMSLHALFRGRQRVASIIYPAHTTRPRCCPAPKSSLPGMPLGELRSSPGGRSQPREEPRPGGAGPPRELPRGAGAPRTPAMSSAMSGFQAHQ
jgi:hypothetical protein